MCIRDSIGDCCGDRVAAAHVFTLFDIQARFADVISFQEASSYLADLAAD